ncbi:MAG: class I SAM-dependent rRNA methyltransferase [Nitrospirota bacterium]
MQKVHLIRTKRLLGGHLWVFSNELHENPKQFSAGSLVEVHDMKNIFLGIGYINPHSLISVRLLTREKDTIDREFFRKKINEALKLRERLQGKRHALRIIFSEGDYLPGLIVDRYGDCIVLQFLTYGIEMFKETIIGLLDEMLNPAIIVLRNDSRLRRLEGLPQNKELVKGDLGSLPVIEEDGVLFEIDPLEGQKTGFFLDQSENRAALKKFIKEGKGLDLFCYTGAWAVHLASGGADVTCVDTSGRALEQAHINANLNSVAERVSLAEDDVFTFLTKELIKGEKKYDFIVLDPPAFVKSSNKTKEAVKAYRELNEMSMRLIKRGGILATSSCSYHLSREMFLDMLKSAGKISKRDLRLIQMRSQGPDHPVLLAMPETEYLKCAFLIVD